MRGVHIHRKPFFLSLTEARSVHMLRHMCRRINRFMVFTLCFSPETSLVSCRWEQPLGKLCSHMWFYVCFPWSGWAQQWDSPCPGVQCGQEIPGCVHAGLQTWYHSWPWAIALKGPAASPCCKLCLCWAGFAPTLKLAQTSVLSPPSTVFQSLPSKVVPIFACVMIWIFGAYSASQPLVLWA